MYYCFKFNVAFIATKLGISAAYNFKKSGICADLYITCPWEQAAIIFLIIFNFIYVVLKLKFLSLNATSKPKSAETQKIGNKCSAQYPKNRI